MTDRQKEIVNFLESLVHTRTNIKKLESEIVNFFKLKDVELYNATQSALNHGEEPMSYDYHLMFNIENDEDYGFYDIYYLPMIKTSNLDGSNIYITEVSYDFND